MDIKNSILRFQSIAEKSNSKLIAVSKTKSNEDIMQAYNTEQRDFGENKVQELARKAEELPSDIQWHMIGHLQRNKVKYLAPFIYLIHSVDSLRLLNEINKQAEKNNRIIHVLLQVHIAKEENKFGLSEEELVEMLNNDQLSNLKNIKIIGLMGMATYSDDHTLVKSEFDFLRELFLKVKSEYNTENIQFSEISMGMTGDYEIALEAGSTMIRIGSAIFGERNYTKSEV